MEILTQTGSRSVRGVFGAYGEPLVAVWSRSWAALEQAGSVLGPLEALPELGRPRAVKAKNLCQCKSLAKRIQGGSRWTP
eukprot:112910-Pyramimonas_sp.AAC.1